MESIKIYQDINREDSKISFGISRMEDVFDKNQGKIDDPHRHDFYTIIFVHKGNGEHRIDFNVYNLGENQLFFLAPGQVHQLIEKSRSIGYAMVFSSAFLAENNIDASFIDDLNLFYDYGQSPPMSITDSQKDKLTKVAFEIYQIYKSNQSFKSAEIGAYLKVFLINCNNLCSRNDRAPHEVEAGNSVLKKFKELVDKHYKEWHGTSEYANEMHISADHLNRTIKSLIGKTAKDYIQSRIITAAKRLIFFTDKSAKEIGFELGFSEPSHFSAFFKKGVGISPKQFKNQR